MFLGHVDVIGPFAQRPPPALLVARGVERGKEVIGQQAAIRCAPRGDVHPRDRGRIFDLSRAHQAYHPFKIIAGAVRVSEEPVPDARARRAIPLIAAALTVIVVAGLIYLRPGAPTPSVLHAAPPVPILSGQYSVDYDFISPSLGWSVVVQRQGTPTFRVFATRDGARTWQKRFTGGLA